MPAIVDGPASPLFAPIVLQAEGAARALDAPPLSEAMRAAVKHAPAGACVAWGIPFDVSAPVVVGTEPVEIDFDTVRAASLAFWHTTDIAPLVFNEHGVVRPARGIGQLALEVAEYVFLYADGGEARHTLRRRHEIGMFQRPWGENCFEAAAHRKPVVLRPLSEQRNQDFTWGRTQMRSEVPDMPPWIYWLWAWQNPFPEKPLTALRIEPLSETPVVIGGITAGEIDSLPYRWGPREKAIVTLPKGEAFDPGIGEDGGYRQFQMDLGQVIHAQPRSIYPEAWEQSYNNQVPELSAREVLIAYTSHPEARLHLPGGEAVAAAALAQGRGTRHVVPVAPARQRVTVRVVDAETRQPVPVKLHVHGAAGEYLPPMDRHRVPNPAWFEDYSADFLNQETHYCSYIDGEAELKLPRGRVFIEISKGFEIRPVKKVVEITPRKRVITIPLRRVLPWRARGWVTADTHVHFLSPQTALLEGAAEGVNIINLLASQWGELMTNVGDFDGKTTWGSREAGGDGEHLVRVGTENRQHVLGHISLLGYNGRMILPLCTGGPNEAALGDPVEVLMAEWARQCREQGGLVVLPHFPNPRAENAANIVEGDADAVEMTSWGDLYAGIDPYSLSDWYRYLNCGYFVPAVAGTDKMSAATPVGAIRTYARIPGDVSFTYDAWMESVRSGQTFVSYGPLLDFHVEGQPAGSRIELPAGGGTVEVEWEAASVTVPITSVELVVNGEIRAQKKLPGKGGRGHWSVKLPESSWLALRVRGHEKGKPEMIAAHASPVMAPVDGSAFFAAADGLAILEQIEGAMAYLDTVGAPADTAAYKRMHMKLSAAHRRVHNRLHQAGVYHRHAPAHGHEAHNAHGK